MRNLSFKARPGFDETRRCGDGFEASRKASTGDAAGGSAGELGAFVNFFERDVAVPRAAVPDVRLLPIAAKPVVAGRVSVYEAAKLSAAETFRDLRW